MRKAKPGLETKVIGCLVADGTDANDVLSIKTAAQEMGAQLKIVAPKIGGATSTHGKLIEVDFQLAGGPSVLFDAVYVAVSEAGAKTLSAEAAAVGWVHDAFAHLKVIGASIGAQALLDAAGVVVDEGVLVGGEAKSFLSRAANGRIWVREPRVRTVF